MLTRINSAKCIGIDAVDVVIEVEIDRGIGIHMVGMADTAVKESLLRIITAMASLGYKVPGKKIVINLAPADMRKNGSGYDLPIALGIIASCAGVTCPAVRDYMVMGELGLDGEVRYIPGALPYAELAQKRGLKGIILPRDCAAEACAVRGIEVYGVRSLTDVVAIIENAEQGREFIVREEELEVAQPGQDGGIPDFADIIGQPGAKRAMEIAAAGSHNIMMIGSPGSGKSTLAKALAGILPPLSREEALVTSKIYSICGKGLQRPAMCRTRPFRAPHHSSSIASLIGGGSGDCIIPGEVSLANNGVLFMDEFAQLPRSVIESLRAPLEDRIVTVSRMRSKITFPASFMLVAASNPCPCGYYGEGNRCVCKPYRREEYLTKLSGPIMDRIDLQVVVRRVKSGQLAGRGKAESSAEVAARVRKARDIQLRRFAGEKIFTNSEMSIRQLEHYCPLSSECLTCLDEIMDKMQLSLRAYHRIIRLARTIADLEGVAEIDKYHIMEAAGYRFLDKINDE